MNMCSSEEKEQARVLLADDDTTVLDDLRALLASEFEVVAAVSDGKALLSAVEALAPDVIVTDIAMPSPGGIAAAGEILRRSPSARIVFVTLHDEAEMVEKGLATGALGYGAKVAAGDDLVPAIRAALRGKPYVSAIASQH